MTARPLIKPYYVHDGDIPDDMAATFKPALDVFDKGPARLSPQAKNQLCEWRHPGPGWFDRYSRVAGTMSPCVGCSCGVAAGQQKWVRHGPQGQTRIVRRAALRAPCVARAVASRHDL